MKEKTSNITVDKLRRMDKQYDKPTPLSYTCSGVHPVRSTGGNFQSFEAIKQEIQNDLQGIREYYLSEISRGCIKHPSSKSLHK